MANIKALAEELLAQKAAVESKGGTVTVAKNNPSPAEITEGIESIEMPDFSLADATVDDVFDGKKFYSSQGTLQTGTAVPGANDALLVALMNGTTPITSWPVPSSITELGDYAITYKTNLFLNNFTLPSNLTKIGNRALLGCTNITGTLTIPSSITSLGEYCFGGMGISNFVWNSPLNTIPNYGFYNNKNLINLNTGPNIKVLGQYSFTNCSNLVNVNLPSVVTIEQGAFSTLTNLKTVDIGEDITRIKSDAFYGCSKMTSLTVRATTPPIADTKNILFVSFSGTIYVPADSVDAYKAAPIWINWVNKIVAIP